jgi:hypothetical protein
MHESNGESQVITSLNPSRKFAAVAALSAAALLGVGGYAVHESRAAHTVAEQNTQLQASLSATNAQVQQLNSKLDSLVQSPVQAQAEQKPVQRPVAGTGASHGATQRRVRRAKDDPRFKKLQNQLDDQGRAIASTRDDIASTRNDLSSARTELGNGLARNHDEIVVLQRKGERNYYEFDINKSKQFASEGPMAVKLRKANVKHQYADLDLMVNDHAVSKKHVNLLEPATFYAADSEQPVLVVINNITKDHIHGYVSAPKYGRTDLSAMEQGATQNPGSADASVTKPRQKLSPR